jgi:hypothetical protein
VPNQCVISNYEELLTARKALKITQDLFAPALASRVAAKPHSTAIEHPNPGFNFPDIASSRVAGLHARLIHKL